MLMRSTGLGKTMLVGKIVDLQRKGDYLIVQIDTTEPVKWRVRTALSFKDLATVAVACAKASVVGFILSPAQWFKKEPDKLSDISVYCLSTLSFGNKSGQLT